MVTEALEEEVLSRAAAAAASYSSARTWTEAVQDTIEQRSHRKRGLKRSRGNGKLKRQKELTDEQLEEEIAYAIGLNAYGINEHEEGVLADDLDDYVYFKVRNHILARWRGDVNKYLSEEDAASKIMPKHRHLVAAAWRYLDTEGHINWGAAPAIMARPCKKYEETVIIIGAGLAGLSAARQLQNHGYNVMVVEGSDRPGGRVHTHRLDAGNGEAAVADLGGSIITGVDGNPLAVLARQLGIPLHDINGDNVPLYLRDGTQLDTAVDMQVDKVFNKLLDTSADLGDQLGSCSDALSLQAALDGLWHREAKRIRRQEQQQQALEQQQQHRVDCLMHEQFVAQQQQLQPLLQNSWLQLHHNCRLATQPLWQPLQPPPPLQSHPEANQPQLQPQLAPSSEQQQQQWQGLSGSLSLDKARDALMQWHFANIEFANAAGLGSLSVRHWDLDSEHEHEGAHVFLPGGNLRLLQGLVQGVPILYKARARLVQYSTSGVQVHTDAGVITADAALVTVPLGVLKRQDGLMFQPPLPNRKRVAIRKLGFGCLNKVVMLFPYSFWGSKDMFGHVRTDGKHRGLYYLFYTYAGISGGAVLAALVAGDAAVAFEQQNRAATVKELLQLLRDMFEPQGATVPDPLQAVCTHWGSDPLFCGSYSSVAVGSSGATDYDAMAKPLGNRVFFAGEATTSRYPATMHGAFATGLREAANIMAAFAKERGEQLRPSLDQTAVLEAPDEATVAAGQQLANLPKQIQQLFQLCGSADDTAACETLEFGAFRAVYGPPGSDLQNKAIVAINLAALRKGTKGKGATTTAYTVLSRSQLDLLSELQGGDERRVGVLVGQLGVKLVSRPVDGDMQQLLQASCASNACSGHVALAQQ